jgi:ankyrin repeat protein
LHLACRNKNEKAFIVKKILDKLKENSKKINYLEAALKKEDNSRQTIYLIAIENNHLNIVEYLLRDFKVNKEQKDGQNGNMAIHFCAKTGSVEMFHLLQKYDAVSFKTNNNQENALHIAAYNNKHKFIKEFLLYEKCLLEKQDSENYMPCICKCDDYHTLSIRQRDHNNYTPLLTALAASNQRCVEELLNDSNIELDAKDISGNSIFHICSEFDNGESLKFLFQHYSTDIIYSKNNLEESVLHR